MKTKIQSNLKNILFIKISIFLFLFVASPFAAAQGKYKPGDRVECDTTGTGYYWKQGTVVPFQKGDWAPGAQPDGSWYRVKIDENGVELYCKTEALRPAAPPARQNRNQNQTGEDGGNRTEENEPAGNQKGAKFKPGDRVECDPMGIGRWVKGTVLPFQAKDNPDHDKDKTGKYFYIHRVRLDNEASTRPEGGMCFTDRTRLLTGADARPPANAEK